MIKNTIDKKHSILFTTHRLITISLNNETGWQYCSYYVLSQDAEDSRISAALAPVQRYGQLISGVDAGGALALKHSKVASQEYSIRFCDKATGLFQMRQTHARL